MRACMTITHLYIHPKLKPGPSMVCERLKAWLLSISVLPLGTFAMESILSCHLGIMSLDSRGTTSTTSCHLTSKLPKGFQINL